MKNMSVLERSLLIIILTLFLFKSCSIDAPVKETEVMHTTTPTEIQKTVWSHPSDVLIDLLVDENITAFNQQRPTKGLNLFRVDLSDLDLRGVDFSGADLRYADLWGANLSGADLRGANLYEADLSRANLTEAYLQNAILWRTNLQRALLHKTDLRHTTLHLARLDGAFLEETPLSGALFIKVTLVQTKIRNVDFTGVNVTGTIFSSARLTNVRGLPFPTTQESIRTSSEMQRELPSLPSSDMPPPPIF